MSNWIRNEIFISGTEEGIQSFTQAVSCKGCRRKCESICLYELCKLGLPNWQKPVGGDLVYGLTDEEPYDETHHRYQVYSANYLIGKLLILASKMFPTLQFNYSFADITIGSCDWINWYSMTIENGAISDAKSEELDRGDVRDGPLMLVGSKTFAKADALFEDCGDDFEPPFLVFYKPEKQLETVASPTFPT